MREQKAMSEINDREALFFYLQVSTYAHILKTQIAFVLQEELLFFVPSIVIIFLG